ncbi:hypothetical protein NIE88_12640 [Sporolactobacillus shoreicorticis]|uniref:Uncharacterized protein n=1 Tax=Sporolactobacillus shoreicorticis TaxID=1923877 RepID=A0ABW5S7C9_9BACL|nr:hypothetical protein [Sporolactobacillus shoreicorticis]MCO7126612.1 hypothetical protein [Sporolactobacillus shoreicorticis]
MDSLLNLPVTYEITFATRQAAHDYYDKSVDYWSSQIGKRTVNNNAWYVFTKLEETHFKEEISKLFIKMDISSDKYKIIKTDIGYWQSPF